MARSFRRPTGLSEREIQVLRQLAGPQTLHEIAQHLFIAQTTLKAYQASIFLKMGVSRRHQAVLVGERLGLLADIDPRRGAAASLWNSLQDCRCPLVLQASHLDPDGRQAPAQPDRATRPASTQTQ